LSSAAVFAGYGKWTVNFSCGRGGIGIFRAAGCGLPTGLIERRSHTESRMPKIDIGSLPIDSRTGYPPPYDRVGLGRERKRLGNAAGLDQFGVNLTTLKPGAASALRHWHEREDEFVYILEGELVLVEDEGETLLTPGAAAGFKAGRPNGHHLVNRS